MDALSVTVLDGLSAATRPEGSSPGEETPSAPKVAPFDRGLAA